MAMFILMVCCSFHLKAQHFNNKNIKFLLKKEDSLARLAEHILDDSLVTDRVKADSLFTRILVRALKTPHSFYFPFDSLATISRKYAPDSSFRIFTWQLPINRETYRYHGAIQMRTEDGSLKLFPLMDRSDKTLNIADTVADHSAWMGAVYYQVVATAYEGKPLYTLIGFHQSNSKSHNKFIEILDLSSGKPVFGGPYFVPEKSARYIMEFKAGAGARLVYDEELDLIVMEHLISETGEPNKKNTLVGDGDYDGFKWMGKNWVFINKLFTEKTPENMPPVPVPRIENKLDLKILEDSTESNEPKSN
jgi:hypothetical protein